MAAHSCSPEAHRRSVAKYNAKTYKQIPVRFNIEKDKEILAAMETAKRNGVSYRQFILNLFYNK